jgi:hypothetical protein
MSEKCPGCGFAIESRELQSGFLEYHTFTVVVDSGHRHDPVMCERNALRADNARLRAASVKVSTAMRNALDQEDKTAGYMELSEDWLCSLAVILEAAAAEETT